MASGTYRLEPVDHDPFVGGDPAGVDGGETQAPPAELSEADKHAAAQAAWAEEEARAQAAYDADASRSTAPTLAQSGAILPSHEQMAGLISSQPTALGRNALFGLSLPYLLADSAVEGAAGLPGAMAGMAQRAQALGSPTANPADPELVGGALGIAAQSGLLGVPFERPGGSLGAGGAHPGWSPEAVAYLQDAKAWHTKYNNPEAATLIDKSIEGGPKFNMDDMPLTPAGDQAASAHAGALDEHELAGAKPALLQAHPDWHPDAAEYLQGEHEWYSKHNPGVAPGIAQSLVNGPEHTFEPGDYNLHVGVHSDALSIDKSGKSLAKFQEAAAAPSNPFTPAPTEGWTDAASDGFAAAKSAALKGGHMGVYDALQFIQANGPGTTVHPSHANSAQIGGLMKIIEQLHSDAGGALPGKPVGWGSIEGDLPASPWSPEAQKYLQGKVDGLKDINPKLANSIQSEIMHNPQANPDGADPIPVDQKHPHYWTLTDIADNAQHIHKYGSPESVDSKLDAVDKIFSSKVYNPPPGKKSLDEAVQPIHWPSYVPPQGAVKPFAPGPNEARAAELGFNTRVPLYKGMSWHKSPGEGLGPSGAFADPAGKPNEPAIYAADQPRVAQEYARPGTPGAYNVAPMYARPQAPYEVNWRDIAPHGSYESQTMQALLGHVKARGGDAVVIHNIGDLGGVQTQYAFMNPASLRVRHAEFDPGRLESHDLLHANPAAMALGLSPGNSIYVPTRPHKEEK